MNDQRLLERIRYLARHPDARDGFDQSRLIESIMSYLRQILNSKQGNALTVPDFGVPDFTNMSSHDGIDSVTEIERSITETIANYEPRLAKVKVTNVTAGPQATSVQFKVEAAILAEGKTIPVVFETILNPNGRIEISG